MGYRFPITALMLLALGCGDQHATSTGSSQRLAPRQTTQPTFAVEPYGFKVNVMLSAKAKRRLIQGKETIIILAQYLTGNPKTDAPVEVEIAAGEDVNLAEVKLPQDRLAQTDGQDPEILVNVFSGRKSSENNLLDCEIYQGGLKAVEGRSIDISCKLIGE
jgi:hypothetical protein